MAERTPQQRDQPAPPGGPLRDDRPSGSHTPGDPAPDPGPQVRRVTRDEGGEVPEPRGTEPEQDDHDRVRQQQNAATSADQPSQ